MDNLCHTLAGASLAEAGLKRYTPLGTATLLVGANLPDVDAFFYAFGDSATALEVRRGWTHGILAMAALPVALAGAMLAWDRLLRRRGRSEAPAVRFGPLLLLAFVSVLSHPMLDFLNTYGVRFLSPFSGRWFYGDALFIVDPWVWMALGLGIAFSRVRAKRGQPREETPARAAIAVVLVYALAMLASSRVGRSIVRERAVEAGLAAPRRVMVAPGAIDPLRRRVVLEEADGYRYAELAWRLRAQVSFARDVQPKNAREPAALAAAQMRPVRQFLVWARFPFFNLAPGGSSTGGSGDRKVPGQNRVEVRDARYLGRTGSWASVTVVVP